MSYPGFIVMSSELGDILTLQAQGDGADLISNITLENDAARFNRIVDSGPSPIQNQTGGVSPDGLIRDWSLPGWDGEAIPTLQGTLFEAVSGTWLLDLHKDDGGDANLVFRAIVHSGDGFPRTYVNSQAGIFPSFTGTVTVDALAFSEFTLTPGSTIQVKAYASDADRTADANLLGVSSAPALIEDMSGYSGQVDAIYIPRWNYAHYPFLYGHLFEAAPGTWLVDMHFDDGVNSGDDALAFRASVSSSDTLPHTYTNGQVGTFPAFGGTVRVNSLSECTFLVRPTLVRYEELPGRVVVQGQLSFDLSEVTP